MQEVKIKSNDTNMKIFINGFPNLSLMPNDEFDLIIVGIELQMTEYFKHKRKSLSKKSIKCQK